MTDPSNHYHRIETAESCNDASYLLARLDGQIARLEVFGSMNLPYDGEIAMNAVITQLKDISRQLRAIHA